MNRNSIRTNRDVFLVLTEDFDYFSIAAYILLKQFQTTSKYQRKGKICKEKENQFKRELVDCYEYFSVRYLLLLFLCCGL
mmetsp:Transcript_2750/g.2953  ORF Transcript_2750/g.2953 Transcript_2750/m.2953 type:complete len:80 (-) Transcript_2750:456-695(-)